LLIADFVQQSPINQQSAISNLSGASLLQNWQATLKR
jgi:hypothetical protein